MSQRGFTLIEMAIVITLIGLMVGGALYALAPTIDKAHLSQTGTALDQVESALELYVIRNNRLPCPANGATLNTDATNYGEEQPIGGGVCSGPLANAVIPWKTLGMDESFSVDGWGVRLSYWTSGMTGIGSTTSVTANTPLMRTGASRSYPTGPFLTVTNVNGNTVTPTAGNDQAAYVLVSHGKSGWYGWNKNSSQIQPTVAVGNKACNSNPTACTLAANSFASGGPIGPFPPQSAKYFDDIVRWRSAAFLIQLCGSGSCGNP